MSYRVVFKEFKNWNSDLHGEPLVKLEDEYGGQSVIAVDDHCFVLFNGSEDREFSSVKHWHKDAAIALKDFVLNQPDFVEFV